MPMTNWFMQNGWMLFGGLGILSIATSCFYGFKYLRFRQFPVVEGVVESSSVVAAWDGGNGDVGGGWTYIPSVTYQYKYNGELFTSKNVYSFGYRGYAFRTAAEKVLQRYSPGVKVVVRYDPLKPSFSFLINGTRMMISASLFVGILFFIFGTLAYLHGK